MLVNFERKIRPYVISLLLSFEIALSFSVYGFITIGDFSLSILPIFVYVSAFCFGTKASFLASIILGLSSMWSASVGSFVQADQLYSPIKSGNPLGSLFLALGVRLILALLTSCIFKYIKRLKKHPYLLITISVIIIHLIYTSLSLVVGSLFFPEAYQSSIENISRTRIIVLLNLSIECIFNSLVMVAIVSFAYSPKVKTFFDYATKGICRIPKRISIIALSTITLFFGFFNVGVGLRTLKFLKSLIIDQTHSLPAKVMQILKQISWQQQISNLALSVVVLIGGLLIYFYFTELQNILNHKASRDLMTNTLNRETTRISIIDKLKQNRDNLCALIIIDIDNFKAINDTQGHMVGDEAIIQLANILRFSFKENSIIGRVGGDEFLVFLNNISSKQEMELKLKQLLLNISTISLSKSRQKLHCSIGVSFGKMIAEDIATYYQNADIALYKVKASGKNNYAIFEEQ